MKHTNFTTIAESEWDSDYREYLKSVARRFDRIFRRQLTTDECRAFYEILKNHQFTLKDGVTINGYDEQTCLGNRAAAAIAGCFHDGGEGHSAQEWYLRLIKMHWNHVSLYHKMLGEIVAHPTVASTP